MSTVRVDPANPTDARAIRRLARNAWHAAYDEFLGEGTVDTVVDEWYAVDGLRDAIADDTHVFPVARDGETIRGFAHAGRHAARDGWALHRIYVAPNHWGDGIGSALLAHVEDALRARDASSYELGVLAENDVGVAFYESRGFERVGRNRVELAGVETDEFTYRMEL